jgi:hypothetical protein
VLVGVVGRAGYATYLVESTEDRSGAPAPPGGTAPVESTSSTKILRCRMVEVNPPENCLADHRFPECFTCEDEVEVASCERGS